MISIKRLQIALLLLGGLWISIDGWAQQVPVFNQYLFNPYLYNPARAGIDDFGYIHVGQKKQWVDLPSAPDTRILTFQMPLKGNKSGVGLTLFEDQTHIINKVGGSATYAYHIRLGDQDDQSFSLGVSAGFLSQRIAFEEATVQNPNDPAIFDRNVNTTTFDVGFGLNYRFKRLNIDVSVPQLANSNVRYLDNTGQAIDYELVSHYFASARYSIPLNIPNEINLEPVVMIRGAKGIPVQYDAQLMLSWYDRLWLGGGYRSGNGQYFASGMNASVGIKIQDMFMLSYTYELPARSADRMSFGDSHEFSVGFKFGSRKELDDLEKKLDLLGDRPNRIDTVYSQPAPVQPNGTNTTPGVGIPSTTAPGQAAPVLTNPDLLEQMELMRQLKQLEDLQKLQQLQKLQELQKLQDLQRMQELQMLQDLENSGVPDTVRRILRQYYNSEKRTDDERTKNANANLKFEKIGSLFFHANSFELTDVAKNELRNVKQIIESKDRLVTIYIAGNASSEGAASYNLVLSNRRAIAVKNYLSSIGINVSVVLPIPYGAENPITKQQVLERDREKNRRVDIFVLAE